MRIQRGHSSTHSGQRWNLVVLILENRNDVAEESNLGLESLTGSSFSEIRLRRNMVEIDAPTITSPKESYGGLSKQPLTARLNCKATYIHFFSCQPDSCFTSRYNPPSPTF
jgi:hypothetical protein